MLKTIKRMGPCLQALPVAVLALFIGCGSDGVSPEEHHAPAGVAVWAGEDRLLEVVGQEVEGELRVQAGSETELLEVVFLDEAGVPVPQEPGTYLEVEVEDTQVAAWHASNPGDFSARLQGIGVGSTQAVFRLMHGMIGSGHPDDVSPAVAVDVSP